MTKEDTSRVRELFVTALEKQSLDERTAYLDQECASDSALRRRIDALLLAHDQPDPVLDKPAAEHLVVEPSEIALDFLAPTDVEGGLGMLGHYLVTDVVGSGGMGVVLRAYDEKLHRVVALKVLSPLMVASGTARARFLREARSAAAVSHDNIVAIHAIEETTPLPFLVMHYVDGPTLQAKIDDQGMLEPSEIVRIGLQIADGLAAAHRQGLIHRDVKPSNILLENGTERVKLTDFGLARAADDVEITRSGVTLGTPAYMSPEQANGEPVDFRTDLFSLGSVMYAMGSGHAPFRADSSMAVLKKICEEEPRPLSEINVRVPDGLSSMINRLMQKKPGNRFGSAAEVAKMLAQHLAYLQGQGDLPSHSPKGISRRSVLIGSISTVAAIGAVVTWRASHGPSKPLHSLGSQLFEVRPVPDSIELASRPSFADSLEPQNIPDDLLKLVRFGNPPSTPERLVGVFGLPPNVASPAEDQAPDCQGFSVSVSRDGRWIAIGGWNDLSVRVWDMAAGGREYSLLGHKVKVYTLAFSPDGKVLATGDKHGSEIILWDIETRTSLKKLPLAANGENLNIAYSPDGSLLAVTGWQQPIQVFDLDTGIARLAFKGNSSFAQSVAFSPDGRLIVGGGYDGVVKMWDVEQGELRLELSGNGLEIRWLGFSPDGRQLAVASAHSGEFAPVRIWDLPVGKVRHSLETPVDGVISGAWRADGKLLFLAGATSGVVRAWEFSEENSSLDTLPSIDLPVVAPKLPWLSSMALTPEGRHLIVLHPKGPMMVFRLAAPGKVFQISS